VASPRRQARHLTLPVSAGYGWQWWIFGLPTAMGLRSPLHSGISMAHALFATAHCDELKRLPRDYRGFCVEKPFDASVIPKALQVVSAVQAGERPDRLPSYLILIGDQTAGGA
jgi:hypothetical protein